eukprot:1360610-Amorphochlora_amoeboformis.AAC.1
MILDFTNPSPNPNPNPNPSPNPTANPNPAKTIASAGSNAERLTSTLLNFWQELVLGLGLGLGLGLIFRDESNAERM